MREEKTRPEIGIAYIREEKMWTSIVSINWGAFEMQGRLLVEYYDWSIGVYLYAVISPMDCSTGEDIITFIMWDKPQIVTSGHRKFIGFDRNPPKL